MVKSINYYCNNNDIYVSGVGRDTNQSDVGDNVINVIDLLRVTIQSSNAFFIIIITTILSLTFSSK